MAPSTLPLPYAVPVDWLVRRLKFQRDLAAGQPLGELLSEALVGRMGPIVQIVPVPLHPRRYALLRRSSA